MELPNLPRFDPTPPDVPAVVSIYDEATGAIVAVLACREDSIAQNVPAGHSFVRGAHRADCRRVNPATKEVEPYQPPAPDVEHVWNAVDERWELPPAIAAKRDDSARALRQIAALESDQARAVRELTLGRGNQSAARAKLERIDDEIAALRTLL